MKDVVAVVAATAETRGIGSMGKLPWRLPADMNHFKRATMAECSNGIINAVIMGRKTWESIPSKFRPLDGRTNVVLTRKIIKNGDYPSNVLVASSLEEAMEQLSENDETLGTIFCIGGAQVYEKGIESGLINSVIYTKVSNFKGTDKLDVFFPPLLESEWDCQQYGGNKENSGIDGKSGLGYEFLKYTRIPQGPTTNPEEMQYLNMCLDIIDNGAKRGDRTGTGTLSIFGTQLKFSLRNGTLPLITTKKTFWRGVAEELLWFISGNTNANTLAEKKIHIWDGNGSREFLDSRGLKDREVGDLGPVYGFQWRHFGAKYVDMHTNYKGQGVDQLAECIEKIKTNPDDRRIVMSAWNPADLDQMALPPCHMFCQFYVANGELSCQMYQRSADMGLGVPFNIASYALLTHLVAKVCGLKPGDFVHTIGDAHIYLNHVDAIKEQLKRQPRTFPKLKINSETTNIDDFKYEDFEVIGYKPHKPIKMKMAI
mmetsp:Transcript_13183/g.15098  ORF Transcript_13183/g.15098 Transcript_13183/m.15098 type:complete len:484 (+) Transcript_13183:205-1656(+)|eukprot:CAMPEP_0194131374 /NCGR_PEP_ID=MMETSP0152-20130528/2168_1 /TAXON_ID=1049557 /ORGANISM="Thalassiothrix antarctica, Strain L6-D1" /LENGTH=483 /DNA_ID=CAMNT_0038826143 /DNA_START=168 /DNA_END=1619 /DNA_ORIENTATION=-